MTLLCRLGLHRWRPDFGAMFTSPAGDGLNWWRGFGQSCDWCNKRSVHWWPGVKPEADIKAWQQAYDWLNEEE